MRRPQLKKNGLALLQKALRAIKRHPETFNTNIWITYDPHVKGTTLYGGLSADLAGHIVLAAIGKRVDDVDDWFPAPGYAYFVNLLSEKANALCNTS